MMQYTTPKARYHVAEHGNGWAYTVTDQETGDSFFVQDEDAAQLQHESDGFCDEEVLGNYMDGLSRGDEDGLGEQA